MQYMCSVTVGKVLALKDVVQGIQHVIADIISKDTEILSSLKTEYVYLFVVKM